jgi:Flp pilus assembly protein TadB
MLLLLIALATLALAVYLIGETATLPARQRQGSIRRAATYGTKKRSAVPVVPQAGIRERAVGPAATALARVVLRVSPKATLDGINAKLLSAGLGRRFSSTFFLAAKGTLAIVALFIGLAFVGASSSAGRGLFTAIALCAAGFFLPDTIVTFKAKGRRERIQAELPST